MNKISFLGCGSWGGALGLVLANKAMHVTMWHRSPKVVKSLTETRVHYLVSSLTFPDSVSFTSSLEGAISGADTVIIAVPSQSIRELLQSSKDLFNSAQTIVNVSKGIEIDTLMTVSEVIIDVLGDSFTKVVTLSGPSHAEEVIQGQPTTLVAASSNFDAAKYIQILFSNPVLRTYANPDIKGVELGGSMKNVIAIAAGICDGIGYGDNTKAALLTRGMTEISRLGVKMGASPATFNGLSGIGDLIVTCLSQHSRNRKVGQAIGEGKTLDQVLSEMKMVAEGVKSAKSVHQLRQKYEVNMPICEAIYQILFEGKDPKKSVTDLMTRELRLEN
ncbi:MAG: NAD(P)H-dependent glycerol-3-phosphate dehydrogenase [Candidatus Marinimicrobia bacterium]|jgi:glycerol-3-phosphate dehydrogenase (NAD(P)+)|nr:NAD(P)H-dependent glycerol-3-phosphate dehydrogenase [Candidatus Neomarinimicrobiota bacterium]MBT4154049.1 NAD(P)H-dependent glycerol-3-phosphate dehydrogenase [Candidatus Neomarinimicrobiota bacterium]